MDALIVSEKVARINEIRQRREKFIDAKIERINEIRERRNRMLPRVQEELTARRDEAETFQFDPLKIRDDDSKESDVRFAAAMQAAELKYGRKKHLAPITKLDEEASELDQQVSSRLSEWQQTPEYKERYSAAVKGAKEGTSVDDVLDSIEKPEDLQELWDRKKRVDELRGGLKSKYAERIEGLAGDIHDRPVEFIANSIPIAGQLMQGGIVADKAWTAFMSSKPSKEQMQRMADWLVRNNQERSWYEWGASGALQMPAMAGEFMIGAPVTGPVRAGATKLATQGLRAVTPRVVRAGAGGTVGKGIAVAGNIAGVGAAGSAMAGTAHAPRSLTLAAQRTIAENGAVAGVDDFGRPTLEFQDPTVANVASNIAEGFALTAIEDAVEMSGGVFAPAFKPAKAAAGKAVKPVLAKVMQRLGSTGGGKAILGTASKGNDAVRRWAVVKYLAKGGDASRLAKFQKATHIDGLVQELWEEQLTEFLQSPIEGDAGKWSDLSKGDKGAFLKKIAAEVMAVTLGSKGMRGAARGYGAGMSYYDDLKMADKVRSYAEGRAVLNELSGAGLTIDQAVHSPITGPELRREAKGGDGAAHQYYEGQQRSADLIRYYDRATEAAERKHRERMDRFHEKQKIKRGAEAWAEDMEAGSAERLSAEREAKTKQRRAEKGERAEQAEIAEYQDFYSDPRAPVLLSMNDPEIADAIVKGRPNAKTFADAFGNERMGLFGVEGAPKLRAKFRRGLIAMKSVPPKYREAVAEAVENEESDDGRDVPLGPYWAFVPDGVEAPNNPIVETVDGPMGKMVRLAGKHRAAALKIEKARRLAEQERIKGEPEFVAEEVTPQEELQAAGINTRLAAGQWLRENRKDLKPKDRAAIAKKFPTVAEYKKQQKEAAEQEAKEEAKAEKLVRRDVKKMLQEKASERNAAIDTITRHIQAGVEVTAKSGRKRNIGPAVLRNKIANAKDIESLVGYDEISQIIENPEHALGGILQGNTPAEMEQSLLELLQSPKFGKVNVTNADVDAEMAAMKQAAEQQPAPEPVEVASAKPDGQGADLPAGYNPDIAFAGLGGPVVNVIQSRLGDGWKWLVRNMKDRGDLPYDKKKGVDVHRDAMRSQQWANAEGKQAEQTKSDFDRVTKGMPDEQLAVVDVALRGTDTSEGRFAAKQAFNSAMEQIREEARQAVQVAVEQGTHTDAEAKAAAKAMVNERRGEAFRAAQQAFNEHSRSDQAAAYESLPLEVQNVVTAMRNHIDQLSRHLTSIGAIDGPLEFTVTENEGLYATRSYQVFDDPNWFRNVPKAAKDRAVAWLRNEIGHRVQQGELELPAGVTVEGHVDGIVNSLLRRDNSPIAVVSKHELGAKDLGILKTRKEIPEVLRELMGEYKSPEINYQKSIAKMAMLAANHKLLTDMRVDGLEQGWLSEVLDGEMSAEIGGTASMLPLAKDGKPLYTTPEIAAAINGYFERSGPTHPVMQYGAALVAMSKAGKTIYNPAGQVRNLLSNPLIAVQHGHVSPSGALTGLKAVGSNLETTGVRQFFRVKGPVSKESREFLKKMVNLGLIGEDVRGAEIRELVRKGFVESPDEAVGNAFAKGFKSFSRGAASLYEAGDAIFKVNGWMVERGRVERAYKEDVERGKRREMPTAEQIDREAADRVRNQYPTYSKIPPLVKALSKAPILADFISFHWEMGRVQIEGAKLAYQDVMSGNNSRRWNGYRRMAGYVFAYGTPMVLSAVSRGVFNISGDDEEAMRRLGPPWEANTDWVHYGEPEAGRSSHLNLGYMDPYSGYKAPVRAFLRGENGQQAMYDAMSELIQPYVSRGMMAGAVLDVWANERGIGVEGGSKREVYNPEARAERRWWDSFNHVRQPLTPGAVLSVEKIATAAMQDENTPKPKSLTNELLSSVGFRSTTVDAAHSLKFKADGYGSDIANADRIYTGLAGSANPTTAQGLHDAYLEANDRRRHHFTELHKDAQAALTLGVPRDKVLAQLNAGGVAKSKVNDVLDGRYEPLAADDKLEALKANNPQDWQEKYRAIRAAEAQVRGGELEIVAREMSGAASKLKTLARSPRKGETAVQKREREAAQKDALRWVQDREIDPAAALEFYMDDVRDPKSKNLIKSGNTRGDHYRRISRALGI